MRPGRLGLGMCAYYSHFSTRQCSKHGHFCDFGEACRSEGRVSAPPGFIRRSRVGAPFAAPRVATAAASAALLGPRERKIGANSRTPAVFNHPRVLPQGHCRFGPALAGSMVGRHRDLEILGASHVLDDALAVVGPPVDAERKVILCHRRALSRLGYSYRGDARAFRPKKMGRRHAIFLRSYLSWSLLPKPAPRVQQCSNLATLQ